MNKTLFLFIDESGNYDPKNKQSDLYILCGCSIPEYQREELKILADQIKFKFWGRTDIVFHSWDIGKNLGDFGIFKDDPKLKNEFVKDLFVFLKESPLILFFIIIDKKIARKKGWNQYKVIKETAHRLIYHFLALLFCYSNVSGKIIIESATAEKDKYYLDAFSYFLSPGFTELNVNYKEVRKVLTSLSFVTKDNFDIEEQIADLFAYGAKCKIDKIKDAKSIKAGSYEDTILSILEQKLIKRPIRAKERKMKFYEKIEPFCILP